MIEFREMTENDIVFLTSLLNDNRIATYLHNKKLSYNQYRNIYRKLKNDADIKHFTVFYMGLPAGWVKIRGLESRGTAWISMLAVAPEYQRRGIGRASVKFAEDFIRSRGFSGVSIHTTNDDQAACRLYSSCSYEITEFGNCETADGAKLLGFTFYKKIKN